MTPAQIRAVSASAPNAGEWLRAVSDVYAHAGQYGIASDVVGGERGVVLAVCDEKRFEFGTQGQQVGGEAQGLVDVLNGQEEVGAWVGKNGAWIEKQGEPFCF